jgi:hypothetical protein
MHTFAIRRQINKEVLIKICDNWDHNFKYVNDSTTKKKRPVTC